MRDQPKILAAIFCMLLPLIALAQNQEDTTADTDEYEDLPPMEAPVHQEPEPEIFMVVEVMPKFPGGDTAMMNFIRENLKYPAEAREKGISGRVIVKFVVEKDGSISQVQVVKGIHPMLDSAALEVVQNMPAWNPGMQRGKPVRVQFVLPIRFQLDEGKPD